MNVHLKEYLVKIARGRLYLSIREFREAMGWSHPHYFKLRKLGLTPRKRASPAPPRLAFARGGRRVARSAREPQQEDEDRNRRAEGADEAFVRNRQRPPGPGKARETGMNAEDLPTISIRGSWGYRNTHHTKADCIGRWNLKELAPSASRRSRSETMRSSVANAPTSLR